jgi:hypothetical protein
MAADFFAGFFNDPNAVTTPAPPTNAASTGVKGP